MPDWDALIDPRRAHHDMGGLDAGGVELHEHDYALWEKRVDAILVLLFSKGMMTVDEMRRNIEGLGAGAYDQMTYYERWIAAAAQTMIQRGIVSVDELGRKIAELRERADVLPEARFLAGDRVAVRAAYPPGHVRTPFYIRGKAGVVERLCGAYANPEELAYARSGRPPQPLYRVRFRQAEVWPDYRGQGSDTIDIEIFQHWLEPAP